MDHYVPRNVHQYFLPARQGRGTLRTNRFRTRTLLQEVHGCFFCWVVVRNAEETIQETEDPTSPVGKFIATFFISHCTFSSWEGTIWTFSFVVHYCCCCHQREQGLVCWLETGIVQRQRDFPPPIHESSYCLRATKCAAIIMEEGKKEMTRRIARPWVNKGAWKRNSRPWWVQGVERTQCQTYRPGISNITTIRVTVPG